MYAKGSEFVGCGLLKLSWLGADWLSPTANQPLEYYGNWMYVLNYQHNVSLILFYGLGHNGLLVVQQHFYCCMLFLDELINLTAIITLLCKFDEQRLGIHFIL